LVASIAFVPPEDRFVVGWGWIAVEDEEEWAAFLKKHGLAYDEGQLGE